MQDLKSAKCGYSEEYSLCTSFLVSSVWYTTVVCAHLWKNKAAKLAHLIEFTCILGYCGPSLMQFDGIFPIFTYILQS